MSGPKSSGYKVDPQVLRTQMLKIEHQRNMASIKNEALQKADALLNQMDASLAAPTNLPCINDSCSSDINKAIELINEAHNNGIYNKRITAIYDELIKLGPALTEGEKRHISDLKTELSAIVSCNTRGVIPDVTSEVVDAAHNVMSKATLFEEETRKRRFVSAAEELYTEAALLGVDVSVPNYISSDYETQISFMKLRSEELRKVREKNTANEYIYMTALQTMKEMGYSLTGEKQTTDSISLRSSLFRINSDTAFNITQSSDGSIVYEVVGVNDTGVLTTELTDAIEKAMLTTCECEYEKFVKLLAAKGIIPCGRQKKFPPDRQFATAKNVKDYSLAQVDIQNDEKETHSSQNATVSVSKKTNRKAQADGTI